MEERGYPMNDFERRAEDISVDHPGVVPHSASARTPRLRLDDVDAAAGPTMSYGSTEDMRRAGHYRALSQELLEPGQ